MRTLLLLRPEPGRTASADRAADLGLETAWAPLFSIEPVSWTMPEDGFDGLVITSANAVRYGGVGLDKVRGLPVFAVGEASAKVAREAGFDVVRVGDEDGAALVAALPPGRFLHLAGEDRKELADDRIEAVTVYRAATLDDPPLPPLDGMVIAVHSPRAGRRLAELTGGCRTATIVALSEAAGAACGPNWARVEWPAKPRDDALMALAAKLCDTSSR